MTHCSARKDDSLKGTQKNVPPNRLYTSKRTQAFMQKCKEKKVYWAIFSDRYGIWFPYENRQWYEKNPDNVTESEFLELLRDFDTKLRKYTKIWFYYHLARFHRLYKRLLERSSLREKIKKFKHIKEIK